MSEPNESLINQPSKTRAEIHAEEIELMKIENRKQKSDYKADFDQSLVSKENEDTEEPSTVEPSKTRAEIRDEELAMMEILNTKYVGEDEELSMGQPKQASNDVVEKVEIPNEKKANGDEKLPEKQPKVIPSLDSKNNIKQPEEKVEKIKSADEKAREIELANQVKKDKEAKEEKEAITERAIENLKALYENKNKLFAQNQKQKDLSYKLKNVLGIKDGEPVTESEYKSVWNEYEAALKDVEFLTGKSDINILNEYLESNEGTEKSVDSLNKKLDNIEGRLKEKEQEQGKEKKDLIESLTGIKDKRVKLLIKAAIAGGMIAFPVGGIAAGALGLGLGEALIGYSVIHYSTAAGLAVGNAAFAVGGISGGSVLLSKIMKEARELGLGEGRNKLQEEIIPSAETPINSEIEEKSKKIIAEVRESEGKKNNSETENEEGIPWIDTPVDNNIEEDSAQDISVSNVESTESEYKIKEDEFGHAINYYDLYRIIDANPSHYNFDSEDIHAKINHLRFYPQPADYDEVLNTIPADGGLRKKAKELIEEERGSEVNKKDDSEIEENSIKDNEFSRVKDFKELFGKIIEISSNDSSLDVKDIQSRILHLRTLPTDYDTVLKTITTDGGLRAKVQELIEKERVTRHWVG